MLGPNVKIASEKKMRAEADVLAGVDNLMFLSPSHSRMAGTQLTLGMFQCAPLWEKIESMLDFNDDDERR